MSRTCPLSVVLLIQLEAPLFSLGGGQIGMSNVHSQRTWVASIRRVLSQGHSKPRVAFDRLRVLK